MMLAAQKFYMMRHGETEANVKGFVAGSLDTALTQNGRNQALGTLRYLHKLTPRPTSIFHSSLSRSRETAEIINSAWSLPLKEQPNLAEQCFGDWQGCLSWEEANIRMASGEQPPNGETRSAFRSRVIFCIFDIISQLPDTALIISHGGVFDAFMEHYDCKSFDVKNCHLYEFICSSHSGIMPWNIRHHTIDENGLYYQAEVGTLSF